jgi:hypothetical protein
MIANNNDKKSEKRVADKVGRPAARRRVRIEPDQHRVVDHRKLARALLRLAQADYETPAVTALQVRPKSADAAAEEAAQGRHKAPLADGSDLLPGSAKPGARGAPGATV